MSDLLNSTAIPSDDARVTIVPQGEGGDVVKRGETQSKAPRRLRAATPAATPAAPVMPVAPKATASDAEFTRYMRDMREYRAAVKALQPKRTKQPVISNKVKALFFANPTMSSEDVAKRTGAKLVTVKTFRGDAVNTFTNAQAAGMLSPAGKKWLDANKVRR